jgi:hypothetical protein
MLSFVVAAEKKLLGRRVKIKNFPHPIFHWPSNFVLIMSDITRLSVLEAFIKYKKITIYRFCA